LDASVIALTHHYLPGSSPFQKENRKGAIWAAMLKRSKSREETLLLKKTGQFISYQKKDGQGNPVDGKDGEPQFETKLKDLSNGIKAQLAQRLAEKRVVQHVPSDRSGAKLELNPWRVWEIHGDPDNPQTKVTVRQRTSTVDKDGNRKITKKETTEKVGKLVGLKPGKLRKNQSVLVIAENYGIALTPQPQIIPFHKVQQRINEIREMNAGVQPEILRNGMLIKISNWEGKNGLWRIFSCKAPAYLDLARADVITMQSKGEKYWRQVSVKSLLQKGSIKIESVPLTGS
jgi:hypothetical protein